MEICEERAIMFCSADEVPLPLEGRLHLPRNASRDSPRPAAIVCHPQPASADMGDPLVTCVSVALAEAGVVALRFNFRGVGWSQGEQTDGRLEPLDVAGAVEYLLAQPYVNPEKVCAIGHAFGAYVALTYAVYDARVRTVVAVSPPTARLTPEIETLERPRLFVTGELDEVSPRYKLEPWIAGQGGRRHLQVITGARHLMVGHETIAATVIAQYVERWAAAPD